MHALFKNSSKNPITIETSLMSLIPIKNSGNIKTANYMDKWSTFVLTNYHLIVRRKIKKKEDLKSELPVL